MATKRLPRRVNFGGGHIIKVVLTKGTDIPDFLEMDYGTSLQGGWDEESKTIYVARELSSKERWSVYWHELIHCINDLQAEAQDALHVG